jgi:hypothetical protein
VRSTWNKMGCVANGHIARSLKQHLTWSMHCWFIDSFCELLEHTSCILISFTVYMRNYYDGEEVLCWEFDRFTCFQHLWIWEVGFGNPSVCPYVMCPLLVPKQFDRFYLYFVFKSLSIVGQCPLNKNILAPKIGSLRWSSRNKTVILLKMAVMILITIQ